MNKKMTDQELALERGKVAILVTKALDAAGFKHTLTSADPVHIEVSHTDLPDWTKLIIIEKSSRSQIFNKNSLRLAGSYASEQMTPQSVKRLMAKLETIKTTVMTLRQREEERKAADEKYGAQKEQDLAGVTVPDWADFVIRTSGDFAGRYRADFSAGSLMERLSAEQVKRLVALLNEFETTAEVDDANHSI